MTASTCALRPAPIPGFHAQVPRHPPDARRDAHTDHRDALAAGGAAPGARGQRQACAHHSLRRARLPAGAHGPHWLAVDFHWRQLVRRRHRTHPAKLQSQRRRQRLDRRHCRRDLRHWLRISVSAPAQALAI